MTHEPTDIRWEVIHEGSRVWIVGTQAGRTYTWSWNDRSMVDGLEFLFVTEGGADRDLEPGEVAPHPSAEAMEQADRIMKRLLNE